MSINATLIGQMITFALLVWFTMKFVWPPIMQALEERKKKISDGLAAAERGKSDLELAEQHVHKLMHEAKQQAADIVNGAQRRATEIVEESKQSAKVEGERMLAMTQGEITLEMEKAKQSLRKEVAQLALAAAGQVLHQEVDEPKHRAILETVTNQLGQTK